MIGAGQAGLATSYHLTPARARTTSSSTPDGRRHVAQRPLGLRSRWSRRPGRSALPGLGAARRPGRLPRRGTTSSTCSRATRPRSGRRSGGRRRRRASSGPADDDGYVATTLGRPDPARHVVVATGFYSRPARAGVRGRHSTHDPPARRHGLPQPGALPDGGVLVVGSGQSGVQIVEDLQEAGREVWLSVGRAPRPRRYRGRDSSSWIRDIGLLDVHGGQVARSARPLRPEPAPHRRARRAHDQPPPVRARRRPLVGRVSGADGNRLRIEPDLHERLAGVDRVARSCGQHRQVRRGDADSDAPPADPRTPTSTTAARASTSRSVERLDLGRRRHRHDHLGRRARARLVVDPACRSSTTRGQPIHDGGVTRAGTRVRRGPVPAVAEVGPRSTASVTTPRTSSRPSPRAAEPGGPRLQSRRGRRRRARAVLERRSSTSSRQFIIPDWARPDRPAADLPR